MENIHFDHENSCQITNDTIEPLQEILQPEIERVFNSRTYGYDNNYASVNLPFDENLIRTINETVKSTKSLNPTTLVVIGIGGSNLGTIAVLEGLRGKFYNEHYDVSVYFVDTVDSDHVNDIAKLVERELETGNNIILNRRR